MRQASKRIPDSAEKTVRDIRRNTRRHHSAEEKIRIVLEGLRGEVSIRAFFLPPWPLSRCMGGTAACRSPSKPDLELLALAPLRLGFFLRPSPVGRKLKRHQ